MTISVSSASIHYRYGQASQTEADIQYAYDQVVASTSEAGIVYRYDIDPDACRFPRQAGFWAWSTQEIADAFPRWHMARHSVRGTTQRLINTWGMGFDEIKAQFARYRKSLFLTTAQTDEPDVFHHAGLLDYLGRETTGQNLLRNPTFAFRGLARRNTPISWTTHGAQSTGTVELVTSPVFMGTHSLKMHATPGQVCSLSQDIVFPFRPDESYTASLWYMVPMSKDYITADGQVASVYVSVMYADGTMSLSRTSLDLGTGGVWKRAHVTVAGTEEVFMVRIGIHLNNSTDKNIRIYAGGAQMELATSPTGWTEGLRTVLPNVSEQTRVHPRMHAYIQFAPVETSEELNVGDSVSYTAKSGRSLYFVDDHYEFWEEAPPMRASTSAAPDPAPTALFRDSLGWYMTIEGERFTTEWRIANNKIEQYNSEVPTEIAAIFEIAEPYLHQGGLLEMGITSATEVPGFSRTLEALCVYKNKLWVLCTETEDGVTIRVIKILDPHSRYPLLYVVEEGHANVHLECLGDVDIGLATGTADYIAPIEDEPDQMLIRVDGTYYLVDLEYDYYMIASREQQAILRHDYEGTLVTI